MELSYLLTPFATVPDATSASGDDAHTILGTAMLTFHENPVLNDVHIPGFDADTVLSSDLLNSVELVKIRLATTSLEELSKIWATINQPYRLSVAYDVSLVMVPPSAPPSAAGTAVSATASFDGGIARSVSGSSDASIGAAGSRGRRRNSRAESPDPLGRRSEHAGAERRTLSLAARLRPSRGAPPTDTALTIAMPLSVNAGPEADVRPRWPQKAARHSRS